VAKGFGFGVEHHGQVIRLLVTHHLGEHSGEAVQRVGGESFRIGQELPDAVKRPEDIRRPVDQIKFRFLRHNRRDFTTEIAKKNQHRALPGLRRCAAI